MQNDSFSDVNNSDDRNFSKKILKLSAKGTGTMFSFSPITEEQKELLHVIVVSQGVREQIISSY